MTDSDIALLKTLCKNQAAFEKAKSMYDRIAAQNNNLRQNLDLLEAAIRNDYDSIVITELDLDNPRIVYVNDGFLKLSGYTREEAVGKTPKILQGPKTDRKVLDQLKEALKEGKSFFGQTVNYKKDGSEFINQWDIHPLVNNNGEITHWVSYQRDITDRKRLEGGKINRFLFNSDSDDNLYERSSETIADFSNEGVISYANQAFCNITGYELEELHKMNIRDLMLAGKGELSNSRIRILLDNDGEVLNFRTLLKQKNGCPVQIEVGLQAVKSGNGKVVRAVVENVSFRKKVFNTLKKRESNYRRMMNKKTDFTYGLSLDAEGNPFFEWLSDGFKFITGYPPEKCFSAGSWKDLVHPDDEWRVNDHIRKVFDGKSSCTEYRIKTCHGGYKKIMDYAKIDDTAHRTVKGTIVDLTRPAI